MTSADDITPLLELFPLDNASEKVLKRVCQTLWEWQDCEQCGNNVPCVSGACPWRRRQKLKPFLGFYQAITSWTSPQCLLRSQHALRSHDDLLDIVRLIRDRPNASKGSLIEEYFSRYDEALPDRIDQLRAFDLAMRVTTMTRCSSRSSIVAHIRPHLVPFVWRGSDSALEFMALAIPKGEPLRLDEENFPALVGMTAHSLEKEHRLQLVGTDDLSKHLLLDGKCRLVHIYHHAGFLKECLLRTREGGSRAK